MRSLARLANADFALWIGRENIRSAPAWTLYVQVAGVSAHGGGRQSASDAEAQAGPMKQRKKKRGTVRHRGRHARRKMQQEILEEARARRARRKAKASEVVPPASPMVSPIEVKRKRRKMTVVGGPAPDEYDIPVVGVRPRTHVPQKPRSGGVPLSRRVTTDAELRLMQTGWYQDHLSESEGASSRREDLMD